jgi:hypothetical protein
VHGRNVIASQMRCRGAKRPEISVSGVHIYISFYCVLYTNEIYLRGMELQDETQTMSGGETFWSGVWFSYKKDLKMGCKNQNWKHRQRNMSIVSIRP